MKKALSVALALSMVIGATMTSFAANGEITHVKGKPKYDAFGAAQPGPKGLITAQPEKFVVEWGGKYYSIKEIIDYIKANPGKVMRDAVESGTLTEQSKPGETDVLVASISAVNKTNIVVLLKEKPAAPLTKDAFKVEGATLLDVKPGIFSDDKFPYELMIESLDGKKGTVKVNGISMDYDFTAEAKAKVESVTFDNYRQFRVTFSEEVDPATATDPANYYFEIVEGKAGLLGANPILNENNSLDAIQNDTPANITVPGTAVNWFGYSNKEKTERYNISAAVEGGKTVVTINMPETARFANVPAKTLQAHLAGGGMKTLDKDTTVFVAVRNVKDKAKVRKIDTAVLPMVIKDEKAPQAVKGVRFKEADMKGAEDFELGAATTVEVPIMGAHASGKTKVQIAFNEPVKESGDLYVNGTKVAGLANNLTFKKSDGSEESTYGSAMRATLVLDQAAVLAAGDFKPGKVHNIKIVGVRDLADNVAVPSAIEFNVKLVGAETPDVVKPEVIGAVQIADNIVELEWNRAGAKPKDANQVRILNLDGTEEVAAANVRFAQISAWPAALGTGESEESDLDNRPGRYFSYLIVDSTDNPATDAVASLDYQGQEFILRKLEVKALTTVAPVVENSTFNKEIDIKLVKDISAPIFKEAAINSLTTPPTTYQEVKAGGTKLLVQMDEVVPYQKGNAGVKYPIFVMKDDGTGIAEPTDQPKELRVSYEKGGITRTAVIQPAAGWTNAVIDNADKFLKDDVLPIDLSGVGALLDDGNLVEGATYTIEFPAGYFADSKLETTVDDKQDYTDAKRTANYGFLSLAFTVKLTVPGSAEISSDLVPQTSKDLIKAIPQPSVNREEIEIEFKGSIDPETLKDPSNYTLNGQTLAAWGTTSADIKYVVDGPNEVTARKFARFYTPAGSVDVTGDVEITVQNIANKLGAKMTPVVHKLALRDNKAPKVLVAKLQGSKEITLTFDEKLADLNALAAGKNFLATVGGKSVGVVKATKQADERVLILELADDVAEGSSIELKVVKDQNGDIHVTDAGDGSGNYRNALPEGTIIKVQ